MLIYCNHLALRKAHLTISLSKYAHTHLSLFSMLLMKKNLLPVFSAHEQLRFSEESVLIPAQGSAFGMGSFHFLKSEYEIRELQNSICHLMQSLFLLFSVLNF